MSKILEFQDLVDNYLWDNPHVTNGYAAEQVAKNILRWQRILQIKAALEILPYGETELFGVAGSVWEEKQHFIVDNNGASQKFTTALEAAIQIEAILQSEEE